MVGVFSITMSPTQKFENKLAVNPYHPFEHIDGVYVYTIRYTRYYFGVAGIIASLLVGALMISFDLTSSAYFLWPIGVLAFSVFTAHSYHDLRHYVLDPAHQIYTFQIGDRIAHEGRFHNVYIRLRSITHESGKIYYFLIFNGYRLDRSIITGVTEDIVMMRRLGQRLAANLAINYFDEPNISPHHVILHEKDDGDWVNDEHETANLTGPPLFRQNTFNFESSFGIR